MNRLSLVLVLLILALVLTGCGDGYRVVGRYTDANGLQRISLISLQDGALASLPAAEVEAGVRPGDCISGLAWYTRTACP